MILYLLSKFNPWLRSRTIELVFLDSLGVQKVADIVYDAFWTVAVEKGLRSWAAVLLATLLRKSTTS